MVWFGRPAVNLSNSCTIINNRQKFAMFEKSPWKSIQCTCFEKVFAHFMVQPRILCESKEQNKSRHMFGVLTSNRRQRESEREREMCWNEKRTKKKHIHNSSMIAKNGIQWSENSTEITTRKKACVSTDSVEQYRFSFRADLARYFDCYAAIWICKLELHNPFIAFKCSLQSV